MDILLTGIFIRVFSLNVPSATISIVTSSNTTEKSRGTSVYVVLNTVNRRNYPGRRILLQSALVKASVTPASLIIEFFFHQKHEMNSSDFFRAYTEGTSSLITLSPTLVDPAFVSVIRAVDGQETGLSVQPAEKKNRLQTGQDFHQQRALVQASLHLKHQPTGQQKERDL